MEETGSLSKIRSCCTEEERQLGNPGETGRPCWRMARRSGGNLNLRFDSRSENSLSESPSSTTTLEDLRPSMRLLAYAANEKHIRFGLGGFVDFPDDLPLPPSSSFSSSSLVVTVVVAIILQINRGGLWSAGWCFWERTIDSRIL